MTKPTIAILSTFYDPFESGAERFVRELVEKLGERYRFVIFTTRGSRALPARQIEMGVEIRRLGFGFGFDKWLFPLLAAISARRIKPSLTHAVMESYAGIALILFRALSWKTPTILTLQSGDLDALKKQWKIPTRLWKLIHTAPTHITAISHYLAERAKRLGVSGEKISIIPNGVDLAELAPLLNRSHERVPYRIVSVGRLSWEKGHEYLVSALPLIRKDFPQAHIVFVGDGPYRERLRKLAASLDLEAAVTFRGRLQHIRAMDEAAGASVFVGPSLAEGMGIVFLEAQALGVPVVATYTGGIPDVVENNVTGLLVPPKDPVAISVAVGNIFHNQELRERLISAAMDRTANFSWEKITRSVASLYERYLH